MSAVDRRREALLADLRRLHRAEPAPQGLRERLVERPELRAVLAGSDLAASGRGFGGRRASAPLRVALAAIAVLGAGVALRSAYLPLSNDGSSVELQASGGAPERPELALGPEPSNTSLQSPPRSDRPAAPSEPAPHAADARTNFDAPAFDAPTFDAPAFDRRETGPREASRCPLQQMPRGGIFMPEKFGVPGVWPRTFEQRTWSCGPLTRRYLELLPPGLPPRASAPVVIVLHDSGESAETMHTRRDRPHFNELAKQNGFILVYANAAPGPGTNVAIANSGGWQRPPRSSLQVDDEEYLRGVVADLAGRRVIDGSNDVFLVGYRDGAAMALEAARRSPNVYAGVAAFAPPRSAAIFPEPAPSHSRHLSRVMIVLDASTPLAEAPRALVRRWGAFLGIEQKVVGNIWQRGEWSKPTGSLERLDMALPATGSSAVRLYVMNGVVENPPGAPQAWDFLRGIGGADPTVPSDSPDLQPDLIVPDGVSVLPEDADGNAYPSVIFDEESFQ